MPSEACTSLYQDKQWGAGDVLGGDVAVQVDILAVTLFFDAVTGTILCEHEWQKPLGVMGTDICGASTWEMVSLSILNAEVSRTVLGAL